MFKLKHDVDRKVERFKARLVAKGYAQKYGIDYNEIFSPVVHFSSIRFLVALAVQHDMQIHQMDVEQLFLTANLMKKFTCSNLLYLLRRVLVLKVALHQLFERSCTLT